MDICGKLFQVLYDILYFFQLPGEGSVHLEALR